jgi:AraC-like DNA-binding protein
MAAVTEIFHSDSINKATRLQYWNRVASSAIGAMHVEPVSQRFSGRIKRRIFRGVELITVESTPVSVEGLKESNRCGLFLLLNQRGCSKLQQRGRKAVLDCGELTALYAHEHYHIESSQEHTTHILYLPGRQLEETLDAHIATPHGAGECELLSAFIRRLAALDGKQPGPGNLLQTTRDLIELNWPSTRKWQRRIGQTAWEHHVRHYIEQHIGEPELNAQRIAEALGITARYVQMIFARMHTTASQYILERRLQLVAEYLSIDTTSRIGDLALEAGFSDLSYFCRCFRNRFGVSAREYRASRVHNG